MEQRDFFISYNAADEMWALWVANVLKRYDYTLHFQAWDNPSTDEGGITGWINNVMKNCRRVLCIWSSNYCSSNWCLSELNGCFPLKVKGTIENIIPIRVETGLTREQ